MKEEAARGGEIWRLRECGWRKKRGAEKGAKRKTAQSVESV